jgi:hypothetical protein
LRYVDPDGLTVIHFNVSSGTLYVDPEIPGRSPYSIAATSGKGACLNAPKPKCESAPEEGPIPRGYYEINVSELDTPVPAYALARRMFQGDWGSFRVRLHETQSFPAAPPFGPPYPRTNHFLHGGDKPGTAGCVDVGGGVWGNNDTRQLISDIRADPDGIVPFTVGW